MGVPCVWNLWRLERVAVWQGTAEGRERDAGMDREEGQYGCWRDGGGNVLDFLCVLKKNSGKYLQVKKIVCTFALHFG